MASTILLSDNGASSGSAGLKQTAGNDGVLILQTTTSGGTATNAIYVDTLQNVGLGVTPLWAAGKGLEIGSNGNALASVNSTQTTISQNAYHNGTSWTYARTSTAVKYQQYGGSHTWQTAGSGTAGTAITFTDAMTLDTSGNLIVGGTTTFGGGAWWTKSFTVNGSTGSTSDAGVDIIGYRTGDGDVGGVGFLNAASSNARIAGIFGERNGANNSGALTFHTMSAGTDAERARIDSSGYTKISNNGSYTNTSGTYHELNNNAAAYVCIARNSNASPSGIDSYFSAAAPNGTGNYFYYAEDSAAQRFAVRSNGGIANFSANNVNLSDSREKTNVNPAGDYLAKICTIPVRTYNYIDQNLEEDAGLTLGVFAQDVQAVAPELVSESNWAKEGEEPKMRLSIYQTDFQYALMKCIQEQQAIITSLTERISALEGAQK